MDKKLNVKITYRNAKLEPVSTQMYDLNTYTQMLRNDLVRLIADVEDAFYIASGNKSKEHWTDDVWSSFMKIKHKLLDKAGEIERLPNNLMEGGDDDGCHMANTR